MAFQVEQGFVAFHGGPAHGRVPGRVGGKIRHRGGDLFGAAPFHQAAGHAIHNQVRNGAVIRGDCHATVGHGLDDRNRLALMGVVGRQQKKIAGFKQAPFLRAGHRPYPARDLFQPGGSDALFKRRLSRGRPPRLSVVVAGQKAARENGLPGKRSGLAQDAQSLQDIVVALGLYQVGQEQQPRRPPALAQDAGAALQWFRRTVHHHLETARQRGLKVVHAS